MTFTNIANNPDRAVKAFDGLHVDDRLALLWFIYEKMGTSITPAAPGAAEPDIADGLFNQVKNLSHEEQLQVQRDLANKADTQIGRQYGSLSANTKLLFWYRLAQGMEKGTIIPMPPNYKSPAEVRDLLGAIEAMDFNQQITFLRNVVFPMGAEAAAGSNI